MLTFVENLGKCQASVYYAYEVTFKVSNREEIVLSNVYLLKSYNSIVAAYSVEESTLVLLPRFNYSTTTKRQVLKWLRKDFQNRWIYSMYDKKYKDVLCSGRLRNRLC